MTQAPIARERELLWVPVEKIIKNERNPRSAGSFAPEQLTSLRRSLTTHGVLQPLIVSRYDDDMYLLIEGERRWTSAKLEGIKELPVIVVNRMSEHDEVIVMFHAHTQRRGWEMAEELTAIQELVQRNGHQTREELAGELGMSPATLSQRLGVLGMGDRVIAQIARGDIDYYAAVRTNEVSRTLERRRPTLVEELGGAEKVRDRLLDKARHRKGMTRELELIRHEAADTEITPDEVLRSYVAERDTTLSEARHRAGDVAERRTVEGFTQRVSRLTADLRSFDRSLLQAPNLREFHSALRELIKAADRLDQSIGSHRS
jgi:ParB/RepB/Spo0J family partition protein